MLLCVLITAVSSCLHNTFSESPFTENEESHEQGSKSPLAPTREGTEAEECKVRSGTWRSPHRSLFRSNPVIWRCTVLVSFSCGQCPPLEPPSLLLHFDKTSHHLLSLQPSALTWFPLQTLLLMPCDGGYSLDLCGSTWRLRTGWVTFPVCSHSRNHLSQTVRTELPATPLQVLFIQDFN